MKDTPFAKAKLVLLACLVGALPKAVTPAEGGEIERLLRGDNQEGDVQQEPLAQVDDLAYLRRVSLDLVGRIPTNAEIKEFLAWPEAQRRAKVVDKLLTSERFADHWTVFFADMLRLRSNAEGGAAAIAFVHRAIDQGMPYDELARRLISASGKAGAVPEVGFILGDNADPMALAGATSQIFMGIRIACAQCHDHPFDDWSRKDFYGLAAYFGKTRRVESQFTNTVYTTEVSQTSILWPPEGVDEGTPREPMAPTFPVELKESERALEVIARLTKLRQQRALAKSKKAKKGDAELEALLDVAAGKAQQRTAGESDPLVDVAGEAKRDARKLNVQTARYRASDLRAKLAQLVANPRNWYFSRSFVNRVWEALVGRGFVNPVDNFTEYNPPSHPRTLNYLADEFVAEGYDLRKLIRMIVLSGPYGRGHAVGVSQLEQSQLEEAFLAAPLRRMNSEVLYDSVVTAGHLFDVKHEAGKNLKVVWERRRIEKERPESQETEDDAINPVELAGSAENNPAMKKKKEPAERLAASGYDLEKAIELDFDSILKESEEAVKVDKMKVMSKEEIEAMRMQQEMQRRRPNVEYFDRYVKTVFDDNPKFNSALRMPSPMPPEHFLRVFGQTGRVGLGEQRDHTPSMRQALMMLNGKLTHEASRVGELEPVYPLLTGEKADVAEAVRLAYREILTREPSAAELAEGRALVTAGGDPLQGMADLRWVLLNCNEFRYLP